MKKVLHTFYKLPDIKSIPLDSGHIEIRIGSAGFSGGTQSRISIVGKDGRGSGRETKSKTSRSK